MCEHPSCTRLISNKCSNHCQLDLCNEHLIEHNHLFIIQYEKSFNNLKNSFNDLINCVEERKIELNQNYQKQLSLINENSNNKSNEIEQQSLLIRATQNLIKKKRQLLTDVKNGQSLLYQYDIEQIKLYRDKLQEYQSTDVEMISSSSSSSPTSVSNSTDDDIDEDDEDEDEYEVIDDEDEDDDIPYRKSKTNPKNNQIMQYSGQCPLTHLNVYGLDNSHNLRLCPLENDRSEHNLMTHFYNYHHIKWSIAYELTNAIINKLNPLKTCIFQPDISIIDKRFYVIFCPLYASSLSKCKKRFHKDSLKQHLLNNHRLSLEIINKICEEFQNKGHLRSLQLDENQLKQIKK